MTDRQFWILVRVLCAGFNIVAGSVFFVAYRAGQIDDPNHAAYGYGLDPAEFDNVQPSPPSKACGE